MGTKKPPSKSVQGVALKPDSATFTFTQDEDSDGRTGEICQVLTVEITNAGGGNYVVLKTERWAFDIEDLEGLISTIRMCFHSCKNDE